MPATNSKRFHLATLALATFALVVPWAVVRGEDTAPGPNDGNQIELEQGEGITDAMMESILNNQIEEAVKRGFFRGPSVMSMFKGTKNQKLDNSAAAGDADKRGFFRGPSVMSVFNAAKSQKNAAASDVEKRGFMWGSPTGMALAKFAKTGNGKLDVHAQAKRLPWKPSIVSLKKLLYGSNSPFKQNEVRSVMNGN